MARSFIIQNNDVRSADVYGIPLVPVNEGYMAVLSGYSIVMGSDEFIGTVYGPISYQIAGPISLRGVTQPYQLSIGGND